MRLLLTFFRKHRLSSLACLALLFALFALSACGANAADAGEAEPVQIRTPHPTFTSTPAPPPSEATLVADAATAQNTLSASDGSTAGPASEQPVASPSGEQAKLIINIDLVNLRDKPNLDSNVITVLERGDELDIVGRDASGEWWFVCCFEEQAGWVTGEFADFVGPADQAPVVDDDATAPTPVPPPAPATNAAAASSVVAAGQGGPVAEQASATEFELTAQEQFAESSEVRVYAYIFDDSGALSGYSLRITKDGVQLPVTELSFGPSSALTWPVADPRQRAQNLKLEFANVEAAGVWAIELVKDGNIIGPAATFTLGEGETNRELYVRYKHR